MAIAINGSGTITGISAGGLPDACITAAELDGAQSGSAPIYAARAWVNFDGTGTVAIRASGNVSSITDNGTGDYTVNFTTAFADANYGVSFGGQRGDGAGFINFGQSCIQGTSNNTPSFTSSQIRFNVANSTGSTAVDWPVFCVAIFR